MPELTLVLPARNESKRLPHTLTRLAAYARHHPRPIEVLVVDDHSDDDTRFVAHQLASRLELRVVGNEGRGPGAAMRTGLRHMRADRALLCDADGPVPFDEIETLWRAMDEGADLAAGSRLVGTCWRPPRPLSRRALARGFRTLVTCLVPTRVRDTQCGFKMVSRELVDTVLPRCSIDGFVFHVELLHWAERLGFEIREVGVPWRDVPGSSIHFIRDPLQMTAQLLALRKSTTQRTNSSAHTSNERSPTRGVQTRRWS